MQFLDDHSTNTTVGANRPRAIESYAGSPRTLRDNTILRRTSRNARKAGFPKANHLPRQKQIEVLRHLVECNTLRSTSRLTGVHRTAVEKSVLVAFGETRMAFMDARLRSLTAHHVENGTDASDAWSTARTAGILLDGQSSRVAFA